MQTYDKNEKIQVHEHGHVILLDYMGSDEDIVDAARISYDRKGSTADRTLLRYLLRHRHTSPFEMAELKFELKMPIFVARQWVRHRTASMNEVSARYTELPDEMFVPEEFAVQSTDNKQGRLHPAYPSDQNDELLRNTIYQSNAVSYKYYEELLSHDVSRELARGVLPLNIYTKFVWKIDLHNLFHFLKLRLDPHAQQEIRDYAEILENFVARYFPFSHEAFVDYSRDAYTCSRMEMEVLERILLESEVVFGPATINSWCSEHGMSKREIKEFKEKFDV